MFEARVGSRTKESAGGVSEFSSSIPLFEPLFTNAITLLFAARERPRPVFASTEGRRFVSNDLAKATSGRENLLLGLNAFLSFSVRLQSPCKRPSRVFRLFGKHGACDSTRVIFFPDLLSVFPLVPSSIRSPFPRFNTLITIECAFSKVPTLGCERKNKP